MSSSGDHIQDELELDLERARQTASMAHHVVVKLKEMGLPDSMDEDLAALSTDLGDLWSAQQALTDRLESLLQSPHEWGDVGDHLVDLKAGIEHVSWHLKSVRRPINKIAQYAYRQAQNNNSGGPA